ncbi:sigma-70 family RNA polymerase sigma factor [Amycolatopsis sp., V23-08]|uniref:Sigma-70 family RNA polymerase sigma factor n=1 Tax=Amycolatopsis heterodermiae TaxID=3110235 RepID=A0ABU5R3T8_9PSEU|nr:sigma-70 family RNA polymerase sigma factor [Amycolatopsis sp., V23-08]MEA5360515.1 sigma-70 family RNA polymerase sigma factor [Amycolatopsis sp., V23-08]
MTEVVPAVAGTVDVPSDAVLIEAVRGGDTSAYGLLYDRHLAAARRVAAAIAADAAERDDLIAEGFTRVLRILRSGAGPDEDFRAYLLTTIRNTMITWRRRDSGVSVVAEVPDVLPATGSDEPVGSRLHATVAADAFAELPERWRTVLWRTEIDGDTPARIAEDLGMTPNSVAALAYRAREGLRQAYLDQHIPAARRRNCRVVGGQLSRWVRDGIGEHKAHRITHHLDRCADCRELATGLRRLNEELPAAIAPLLLGVPFVTQWLSGSLAGTGAAAGTGAVAGTGASALSWATAAKVAAASAALVTTVTIGASTSAAPPPAGTGGGVVAPASTTVVVPARPAGQQEYPASAAQLTTAPEGPAAVTTSDEPEVTDSADTSGDPSAAETSKQKKADKTKEKTKTKTPKTSKTPKPDKTKTPKE